MGTTHTVCAAVNIYLRGHPTVGITAYLKKRLGCVDVVPPVVPPVVAPVVSPVQPSDLLLEPRFNPAVDASLFDDDCQSYADTAALVAKYWLVRGNVALVRDPGKGYEGSDQFVRFDYTNPAEPPNPSIANEIFTTQHHHALLASATQVVLSWGERNTGPFYSGKRMIIQSKSGRQRWVLVGQSYFTTPQDLQDCFWNSIYPYDPLYAFVPPRGSQPAWSRDGLNDTPENGGVGGPAPHFLQGNMGYPDVQFPAAGTVAGPANDGAWGRFTYRMTRESAGPGTGRIEGWFRGIKFLEYIGDDPTRREYRKVWSWGATNTIWDGDWYFVGTTSGAMGPVRNAIVDMGGVRLFVPGS
jgi:hypothetical protein